MRIEFNKPFDYESNRFREWVIGNGLGGYCGGTVIGSNNRTHQGYLIASLHPPVERKLILAKTIERCEYESGECISFACSRHLQKDGQIAEENGNQYLEQLVYDGCANFFYQTFRERFQKTVALAFEENECAIYYEFENQSEEPVRFVITPLFNYKEHSENQTVEGLQHLFDVGNLEFQIHDPNAGEMKICFSYSDGIIKERAGKYDIHTMLPTEIENEVPGLECHYMPFDCEVVIAPHEKKEIAFLCSVASLDSEESPQITANEFTQVEDDILSRAKAICENRLKRVMRLEEMAERNWQQILSPYATVTQIQKWEEAYEELVQAADALIVRRESTGYKTILAGLPWFTDWGRDTMIAFTGLTLCTGRFEDAKEILLTFAQYVKNGMVPNMFPDDGQEPLYNTADASLWYFYAVYQFLQYDKRPESRAFVMEKIYPALEQIIEGYKKGTDFSIYMDTDGLIHAGSGLDQVTWMDVRVGDWVATPRHGKPVEINALWYQALCIMRDLLRQELSNQELQQKERLREKIQQYDCLAQLVKKSFTEKFWNEKGYLNDVIEVDDSGREYPDETIRPNQIYAVSLPYPLLTGEQEKAIVDLVYERLYVGVGLRSLDPADPNYHPIYKGALRKRDEAYHQGTAWGFLLGAFLSAYAKVYPERKKEWIAMFNPIFAHMRENGIGTISEIFDGDAPHLGRGCYSQAWSVGEILRAMSE